MNSVFIEDVSTPGGTVSGRDSQVANASVRWGAIFSGLFVAFLAYLALVCLGLAFGSGRLETTMERNSSGPLAWLGIGASVWTLIAALLSIGVGSYVSGRVAGLISNRVGRIQGLVIASLFFTLLLTQAGIMLFGIGGGLTSMMSGITGSAMAAASAMPGRQIIEDAIGDLDFRSPPSDVVNGVAARLLSGDDQSAITYLANETGLDATEARERYQSFKGRVVDMARTAGMATARTAKYVGWTLFLTLLLGSVTAMLAGGLGASYNLRAPVSKMDLKALRRSPAGATLAWLALAFILMAGATGPRAFAAGESGHTILPKPVKAEPTIEGTRPTVGVFGGVNSPSSRFSSGFEHGVDVSYQPYIPYSLGLQLSMLSTERTELNEKQVINRTNLLAAVNYNLSSDVPIIKYSYLGLQAGAVFDDGLYTGTHFGLAPAAGFDVPLTESRRQTVSLGLQAKYLFVSGPSPDAFSLNAMAKYWF